MRFLLIITLLTASSFCHSQIPYGMVEIKKGVYIDDMETTIGGWLVYVFKTNPDGEGESNRGIGGELLPDSLLISQLDYGDIFDFSEGVSIVSARTGMAMTNEIPVSNKVLKRLDRDSVVQILNQPITGLTYQQAVDYCRFIELAQSSWANTTYRCSMPSRELLEYIRENEGRTDTEWLHGGKPVKRKKIVTYGDKIRPAAFGYPNNFGMFELWNNADEMTDANGYKLINSEGSLSFDAYTGPEIKLGFRCACRKEAD